LTLILEKGSPKATCKQEAGGIFSQTQFSNWNLNEFINSGFCSNLNDCHSWIGQFFLSCIDIDAKAPEREKMLKM
jgi:hypothetical protein